MDKDFFSVQEAAKMLRVSRVTVFKKIKKGEIEAVKVGRNFVIQKDDLAQALGQAVGRERKGEIEKAVDKAVKEYGETFRRLGKELGSGP